MLRHWWSARNVMRKRHRICPSCGYYNGEEILRDGKIVAKIKDEKKKSADKSKKAASSKAKAPAKTEKAADKKESKAAAKEEAAESTAE